MKKIALLTLILAISIGSFAQTFITQVKPYKGKLWGYINQNEETVIDFKYKKCYQFAENGLAPVYESKQFQFINIKGEVLPTDITGFKLIEGFIGIGGLQGFSNGMLAISKDKKWGFFNTEGSLVIELNYDEVTIFHNNYCIAKKGDVFFILDKSGVAKEITGASFTEFKHFSEDLAPFKTDEKTSGFINTDGEIVIPANFLSVGYFADDAAWAKSNNNKVGFIDKTGNWIIEPQFDVAKNFDPVSGLARIKEDGNWSYVNKKGEITNIETEVWGDFSDGLAKGKKDGKIGYFNNKGEWIIPASFEGGRNFKNGFAAVKNEGKWGFMDKSGKWIIKATYSSVKDMERID